MSKIVEELRKRGCDMDITLERFLGDEEFYEKCLKEMLCDKTFDNLGKALNEHNISEAFDCAHTLKGLIANMGITSMLDIVVRIVEPLRNKQDEGLEEVYKELVEEKESYIKIIS